jgi:hypothetical protein
MFMAGWSESVVDISIRESSRRRAANARHDPAKYLDNPIAADPFAPFHPTAETSRKQVALSNPPCDRFDCLMNPQRTILTALSTALVLVSLPAAHAQTASAKVSGELMRWHTVTVTLDGPQMSATASPNPFLDLRMDVTFTHAAGTSFTVPGFFDADGDAANTSASSGNKWRARFTPDRTGNWKFRISFRQGAGVAVAESANAGTALAPFDDAAGTFSVAETNKTGNDLRARGRLQYVNKHHLQFAGTREWFLKAGADSPENLLAYEDFDDTPNYKWEGRLGGGFRKNWQPHVRDWKDGDPTWKNGKGKGLIGAMNYLASKGLNSQSFLTYSVHGDDRNVSPYIDSEDRTRISIPKMSQWEIVFDHMSRLGLFMEFKLMEMENDWDMDGGELGPERKLYYRELIARFGHHLGLNWNVGEENSNTPAQRKEFGRYIYATDPYHHLINIHNIGDWERLYLPLIGKASPYKGASLQIDFYDVFDVTRFLRMASQLAGSPWVITLDETRPGPTGEKLGLLNAAVARDVSDPEHNEGRKGALWANLMAGGAGMNTYVGFGTDVGDPSTTGAKIDVPDLMLQDFRAYDKWWDQMRAAHGFFVGNRIPFQEMSNRNELLSNGWTLAGGDTIVGYFPDGVYGGRGTRNRGLGSGSGAAYAPPIDSARRGPRPRREGPRQPPGAMGGPGALTLKPGADRHGQDPVAGPGTPPDSPTLDLRDYKGSYQVRWFDPRKGGALQTGSIASVRGGGNGLIEIGHPPSDRERDWVVLIRPETR